MLKLVAPLLVLLLLASFVSPVLAAGSGYIGGTYAASATITATAAS